ncbi:hypothetical protein [Paraburkholderia rhizosphaerae]|uniref:Uncharacterized protein n=1 Tax=Paraburkholderia rhizosphaerae TaxID=480658 RepID=A0A4R8LH80_9BURK|nr:hypothetical protein [Paraburkholderia rhizosphaerae]TDY42527.1 hypothetical protein BX592_12198 [Paraburkholderia rhizosphaerae]
MDFVSLALLAVGFVGLGSAATVLLTNLVPLSVAASAARHGRFAGLAGGNGGVFVPAPFRASVKKEAMNVVGSSN